MKILIASLLLGSMTLTYAGSKKPAAPPPPPTLQDFAWHQEFIVSGRDAAYRIELPASVYTGSQRADLGDMRIFNGNGELLPYAFLPAPPVQTQAPTLLHLPSFPIHTSTSATDSVNIDLQADKNGQLKRLRIGSNGKTTATDNLGSYILDASTIKQPIAALKLAWTVPAGDNVVAINVESSDNLQDWRLLRSGAPLMDVRLGEQQLRRDRIELDGVRAKYLRLSWKVPLHMIVLTKAEAEITGKTTAQRSLQWHGVNVRTGSVAGEYLFDADGLPVETLRISLPQLNTVAPYRLFHRNGIKESWYEVANVTGYRLMRNGQEINAPDLTVGRSRDRHWRLLVNQRGGGLGGGLPTITLGYTPQQLMFIARGTPPFRLAYGNAQITAAEYAPHTLLPDFRPEQSNSLALAQAGSIMQMGSPLAATADVNSSVRNKMLLWGVLLLGVTVLGIMVWRLLRQMHPPST